VFVVVEEGKSRARDEPRASSESDTTVSSEPEPSEEEAHASDSADGDRKKQELPSAPSLGPKTVIEREPVEERLARHEQSDVDAVGEDKRRAVVGKTYGPTKARQLTLYGIFLAVVAALVIGGILLVNALDTPVGKNVPNSAPWAQPGVKQHPPKPLQ
jgi:hypothetical protein